MLKITMIGLYKILLVAFGKWICLFHWICKNHVGFIGTNYVTKKRIFWKLNFWIITFFLKIWIKKSYNFRCHAGEVTALTGSKISSLVLSGGVDGKTCIYDMNRKLMINHVKYSSSVSAVKWLPLEVNNFEIFLPAEQWAKTWKKSPFWQDNALFASMAKINIWWHFFRL